MYYKLSISLITTCKCVIQFQVMTKKVPIHHAKVMDISCALICSHIQHMFQKQHYFVSRRQKLNYFHPYLFAHLRKHCVNVSLISNSYVHWLLFLSRSSYFKRPRCPYQWRNSKIVSLYDYYLFIYWYNLWCAFEYISPRYFVLIN